MAVVPSKELEEFKNRIGNTDSSEEQLLQSFLNEAKAAVLNKMYPFDKGKTDVPKRYLYKVVDIAVFLYNKQGAEGQTAHSENGINRTYESGYIPESMLMDIMPYVGGF